MDIIDFGRYIGALLVTLAILGAGALGVRRFAPQLLTQAGASTSRLGGMGKRRAERRMRVVEALSIDAKRRVVLIAVDGQETAVLLGPTADTVLIAQPAPDASDTPQTQAPQAPTVQSMSAPSATVQSTGEPS